MERCRQCGRGPALDQWCSECRHRARIAPPGSGTVLGVGVESARARAVPGLLWAAIGTFAGGAVLTMLVALTTGLSTLLPALVIAGALGLLAHQLYSGSRLARALSVVLSPTLFALAVGTGGMAAWVVIAMACCAASAVLTLAPTVRAFYLGPFGRPSAGPVSVALVRVVIGVVAGFAALAAAGMLVGGLVAMGSGAATATGTPAGMIAAGFVGILGGALLAVAIPMAAVAVFWFWAVRALGSGNRGARLAVTIVSGLDVFVLLIAAVGSGSAGAVLVGLVLHAAVVAPLWLPSDARRHFGEAALPVVEEWHRSMASAFTTMPGAHPPAPGPVRPAGPAAWAPSFEPDPITEPIRLGRHARREPA